MNLFKALSPSARSVAAEYLAKVWMTIAAVLVGINLFVVLTLLQMAPKVQVISQVLTFPMNSQEFIQAEPFSETISDRKLIDETLIRYYLDMRLSEMQDPQEMGYRWGGAGPVALLSSRDVYKKFAEGGGGLAQRLREVQAQPHTVSVHITHISRWDNTFVVDFDLYHYANGSFRVQHQSVTIVVAFTSKRHYLRVKDSNPYGMYVKKYTQRNKNQ